MHLRMTIESGTLAGSYFDVFTNNLSIGRNRTNGVRFDPQIEKIVSGQHAEIEARSNGFFLVDQNSTNGTYVNGIRISEKLLVDGDFIEFGREGIRARIEIQEDVGVVGDGTQKIELPNIPNAPPNATPNNYVPAKSVRASLSEIGVGIPIDPTKERNTGQYVGVGIACIVAVFFGLIVVGIMVLSLGPVAAIIATVVAFIPALFYIIPFVWLDRYDPEPFWLLASLFAWGALVAVVVSFIFNTTFGYVVGSIAGPEAGSVAGAVISAPIVEEISKGAGLFIVIIFFRKYFDGILDGIIFAGLIALGFSTVENVLYYGRALVMGGSSDLLAVFIMRGILSPFVHASFTAMTGIGLGVARESHNKLVKYTFPILGLMAAIFLHAFWNGVASFFGAGFLIVYLLIEIPFFLIFVGFAGYTMWRQNRILKETLAIDVAQGLITQEHYEKATSAFRGAAWLASSVFSGNYRATSKYLRAIGKLGLSYWHIQRATQAQSETASFQQNPILRAEVQRYRADLES